MRTGAIVVAAGSGQRMKGKNKILATLGNKPLLAWSVDVCQDCPLIDEVVIVLREEDLEQGRKLAEERGWFKLTEVCCGGERRQDSVKEGLKRLKRCDWVMIHDGARPFLTFELIRDGLRTAVGVGAAVAAVPVKDTIKMADNDMLVMETLERRQLWSIQTPQIFRWEIITSAYEQMVGEVTDDAALVERLGHKVKLYVGDYNNIKVTTPEDLMLAEVIAASKL